MPQRVPGRGVTAAVTLPARADALAWAGDGAAHLRGLMTRMGDSAFRGPSLLPGWSRAHVLTHVARNADAMISLLTRARTGESVPADAGRGQRDADIDAGAARDPEAIRADVIGSSDRLADAVRAMPESAWPVEIETSQGVRLPAEAVPWGRAREVWIHAVDLDVGASFADMPAPMLVVLVADVAACLGARPGCPRAVLQDADTGRRVEIGPGPDGPAGPAPDLGTVCGSGPDLAAWLLGRSTGAGLRTSAGARPGPLPAWL